MIELYTDSSPNGFKITIALEEMHLPYILHHINIDAGDNKRAAFLKLNPHGRIPVLVDNDAGITLFESAAILLYLANKSGQLLPKPFREKWEAIKWLTFHASSVGPIIGQRVHYELFSTDKHAPSIERYRRLTNEAFATLDQQLAQHPYLAGDTYSIADIANFGWTHIATIIGMDFSAHVHLSAWHARIAAREAVQIGITIPAPATGA
jgi:GST-like protein